MAYPIIKYRLRADGRVPEYLAGISTGFSGECGTDTNVAGCMPKWLPPQETLMLGLGIGTADPAGLPNGCEGIIANKSDLQTYIGSISGSWKTSSESIVGVSTYKEEGIEANFVHNGGNGTGITTTNITPAYTASAGAGTTVGVTTSIVHSDSVVESGGTRTLTRTYTTTIVNQMENPFDAAAKATELWDIYEAVNGL